MPLKVSIFPLKSVMMKNCSQVKSQVGMMLRQMSFPDTVSDSLFRNSLGCANPQFHQLSGWLVSDNPAGEEAECGGSGLVWLHVVCGCEVGWMYCQIL
jgi:hypothetical protein